MRSGIGQLQQHICMTRRIQRAPAHEVMAAKFAAYIFNTEPQETAAEIDLKERNGIACSHAA